MPAEGSSAAPGTLWIVATPIGTIGDLGPRSRQVLGEADLILAEDTRHTRRLLSRAGITAHGRLRSLHEHNEDRLVPRIADALEGGQTVALVSDAGTPVLSDPGFVLVREARLRQIPVLSVPGPSSFTAALAASGQPPLPATLIGFLPARAGPRRRRIRELAVTPWTMVILLSPHRLQAELRDLASGLGAERPATLLAELSKLHERAVVASLAELCECAETDNPRGEYVLVVGPQDEAIAPAEVSAAALKTEYEAALADGLSRKQALGLVAEQHHLRRRDLYRKLFIDGNAEEER
jgi:16S rRNA (cytidine1402-2'-O)-methyltransferase